METTNIRNSLVHLGATFCALHLFANSVAAADPVSEMASFSAFNNVDLAQLAKTDVKAAHGVPMSTARFLSVQSCYVVPHAPAREIELMRKWNPTPHRELKVYLHSDLSGSPSPESFSRLRNAPDNGPVRALVSRTQKLAPDLQISKEEAKKFSAGAAEPGAIPASVASFWSNLLSARARAFASGGSASQPSYDHSGQAIRPNEELSGLLREQPRVKQQFSSFLSGTGIGHGGGGKPDLYWELLDVDGQGVVSLGATYSRAASGGSYQVGDTFYYSSGGYYVTLTLFQLWPVTVNGAASTLVWRGDFVSAAELGTLHGVERLGSESAMMKNITKAVTLYRRDTSSAR
jgi:hypothetical protein